MAESALEFARRHGIGRRETVTEMAERLGISYGEAVAQCNIGFDLHAVRAVPTEEKKAEATLKRMAEDDARSSGGDVVTSAAYANADETKGRKARKRAKELRAKPMETISATADLGALG